MNQSLQFPSSPRPLHQTSRKGHPEGLWSGWGIISSISLVAQTVENLPTMQETQVQSLGWEDPLEKGMATHSSILSWRIPWTEEPGSLQSMELQSVGHD